MYISCALVCHVMRWLRESKHNILRESQSNFISAFHTILYRSDKTEAANAFISAIEIGEEFPEWQNYLRNQYVFVQKGI